MKTYSPSSQGVLSAGSSKLMRNHSTIALTAAACFIRVDLDEATVGPCQNCHWLAP